MKLLLVAVLVLTGFVYANSLRNEFIGDDLDFIVRWEAIRKVDYIPYLLKGGVPAGHEGTYRPVRSLWYLVLNQLIGQRVIAYHLWAIVVHLAATGLIFLIVLKLAKKLASQQNGLLLATLTGLIFGLHPIHTEAVTFITASFDTVGLTLALGSVYSFLIWLDHPKKQRWWYGSLILTLLAVFNNEIAIMIPILIWLLGKAVKGKRFESKTVYGFFIISAAYLFVRVVFLQIVTRGSYQANSFWLTFLISLKSVWAYWLTLILPINLSITRVLPGNISTYTFPELNLPAVLSQSVLEFAILGVVIVSLTLGYMAIKNWQAGNRFISVSIAWFYIFLLPLMNIFPSATLFSERYIYMASVGFTMLLAIVIMFIYEKLTHRHEGIGRIFIAVIFGLIIMGYGSLTWERNKDWKSEVTFWQKAASQYPTNTILWYQLGKAHQRQAHADQAIDAYNRAITLAPQFTDAYQLLGQMYQYRGQYDMALESYQKALTLNPNLPNAIKNVATVYTLLGKSQLDKGLYDKAARIFKDAIRLDPGQSAARLYLQDMCQTGKVKCS
jgi:hypothetical protein